jgi:carbon storage regulator
MLVLTRKLMEKLFIGDDICVTVVRLEGGQVRLGIDAPREVAVVRAELIGERSGARFRPASRPAEQAPALPPRGEVRYSPRYEARETDNRRRGRSR